MQTHKTLLKNLGAKLRHMMTEDWRNEDERNILGMAGHWLEKLGNDECMLELTIGMLEQDMNTIRSIIDKGGTTTEVLEFLDTPSA